MASLPSFIELMGSLALEQTSHSPSSDPSLSPNSSPSSSPQLNGTMAPSRSKSSPSLRKVSSRDCSPRYSPYSSYTRRGSTSCSSFSDSSSTERCYIPPSSSSSLRPRRSSNRLTINIYGSTSDLPAYTPISGYLRRKTPGASPTSPGFPRSTSYVSTDIVLPILLSFPSPTSTESSSPETFQPDVTFQSQQSDTPRVITETTEVVTAESPRIHRQWHPGVRLSTPSFSPRLDHMNQCRLVPRLV